MSTFPAVADAKIAETYRSPLLDRPGAVAGNGPDRATAWHYGDPLGEQRRFSTGAAVVDRSDRGIVQVSGADRLSWLHSICSQHVSGLADGDSAHALVLSPTGHVEQDWRMTELAGQVWIDVEPGTAPEAMAYLTKMIFMRRVEPREVSNDFALLSVLGPDAASTIAAAGLPVPAAGRTVTWSDGFVRATGDGFDLMTPRPELSATVDALLQGGATLAGSWALAARRVERGEPRLGAETDHRTIPHEVGLIGEAVHLNKGCYRGQETVARVQNLGRPPRRLVRLHLSGERDELPAPGTEVRSDGRVIGFLGTAVHHHELGPIALAVVKRTTPDDAELEVGAMTAAVDPM